MKVLDFTLGIASMTLFTMNKPKLDRKEPMKTIVHESTYESQQKE